jgi:hypothetical protein
MGTTRAELGLAELLYCADVGDALVQVTKARTEFYEFACQPRADHAASR